MPQATPPPRKVIMQLDGSLTDEMGRQLAPPAPSGLPGLIGAGIPKSGPSRPLTPEEENSAAGLLGDTVQIAAPFLAPGAGFIPAAIRAAMAAGIGGAKAAVTGQDAGPEALKQGALQAGGDAIAHYGPIMGVKAALAMGGGVLPRFKGKFTQAADAFLGEAASKGSPFVPIGVGQQGRTAEEIKRWNSTLGNAIDSSPHTVSVDDLRGTTGSMHTPNARRPEDLSAFLNKDEQGFINQQTTARGGELEGHTEPGGRIYVGGMHETPHVEGGAPRLGNSTPARSNDPFNIPDGEWRTSVYDLPEREVPPTPPSPLSMRDLQDTLLDLTHGSGTKNVVNAEKAGTFVPPSESLSAQADLQRGAKLKGLRNTFVPEAAEADEHLARLHTMQDANQTLRGGGSWLADNGMMLGRTAAGTGVGAMLGHPYLGGAAGMLGLAPQSLSAAGFAAGEGAKWTPTFINSLQEIEDLQKEKERNAKRVQLRSPK